MQKKGNTYLNSGLCFSWFASRWLEDVDKQSFRLSYTGKLCLAELLYGQIRVLTTEVNSHLGNSTLTQVTLSNNSITKDAIIERNTL